MEIVQVALAVVSDNGSAACCLNFRNDIGERGLGVSSLIMSDLAGERDQASRRAQMRWLLPRQFVSPIE